MRKSRRQRRSVKLTCKSQGRGKKAAEAAKKGNIGGHADPEQSGKNPEAEAKQRLATERRLAQELAALQAENRKEEIDRMQDGTEKKLAQIEYDYNARKEEINRQEAAWKRENKEAGISTGGNGLTPGQADALAGARDSNDKNRSAAIAATLEQEKEKEDQAMRDYLSEYGSYEERSWPLLRNMRSVSRKLLRKVSGKRFRKN